MNRPLRPTAVLILLTLLAGALAPAPLAAQIASPAAAQAPDAAQTLVEEGFEGTFPGNGWAVFDVSNDGYTRFWGKDAFKPHSGSASAWPASGGPDAVDPTTQPYPDDMNTQMVYGPFDFSNAIAGEVRFWLWLETETEYGDSAYIGVSADGNIFSEKGMWEGSLDWSEIVVDLSDYLGDNSVWVRWDFFSDPSIGILSGGAFIDDIRITRQLLDPPVVTITRSDSNIILNWPAVAEATAYEVWRGVNAPYFTPGTDCAASPSCTVVNAPAHAYTHTGGSGSTASNYAYAVLAVKGTARSTPSKRLGEFDFSLVRGG